MFSGIIQNLAEVADITKASASVRYQFSFRKKEKNVNVGDSIAVNGVCLTVVKKAADGFSADVVGETLKATTLGNLRRGNIVNIERSLKFGSEVSGHFVTGHVDGRGIIKRIEKKSKDRLYFIEVPEAVLPLMAVKGSIAVDGISLTIQGVRQKSVKLTIIPHTLASTNLKYLHEGSEVNVEADMTARYLFTMLQNGPPGNFPKGSLSFKSLTRQGF